MLAHDGTLYCGGREKAGWRQEEIAAKVTGVASEKSDVIICLGRVAERSRRSDAISLVGFQCFCLETLADQPANGLRARRLISLSAPPIINGVSEMRGDAETQDWILADSGSPALFLYYVI